MPRRVSLPAADELFRSTGGAAVQPSSPSTAQENAAAEPSQAPSADQSGEPAGSGAPDEGAGEGRARREPRPKSARERGGREERLPAQAKRDGSGRPTVPPAGGQPAAPGRGGAPAGPPRKGRVARRPSGRERHDEKITVYVSAEELMDLEHARLVLRGEHGLAVDRGRIVREAVAVVLADLESRGDASILVRRLRGR
ncbi:hypothetical protein SAMN06297387_103420 [Streptomyces zhaozhouensis]|uniref:Cobyrinic acid a,c-diamide synthase n=1 Tax=Streptomyces zhaozhouensis TaxID=1300267 RepID=A0A286DT08_9ACTN|nr:hypothetical protein [Streptomyces zhaozhouensis]SOD61812.1 hypothetical protein SAMN06297387_103420 [Streptomyces zhaozhouensis]